MGVNYFVSLFNIGPYHHKKTGRITKIQGEGEDFSEWPFYITLQFTKQIFKQL